MGSSRQGASPVAVIVGLIVLAAVAFGVFYFTSDVFRTKANAALDQWAHWTPENIAKDPLNYLNFCEEQTKVALEKTKASEIAIAQKKAKIENLRTEAQEKITLGNKALDELKAEFKKREASKEWPLTWRGNSLDMDTCKRQIMRFATEVKSKTELVKKYDQAATQLTVQTRKVQEARDSAQQQMAKIDANREMLKVQQITDDLKNNLVSMKAAIEQSVVGVASAETGAISLDDLAAQSQATVNDDEFAKIMKE
jgi:hypothetical protein